MSDAQKRETLGFLIADAEKVLDIRDEGPLVDDFSSLKDYYSELEEKILSSQGISVDLSGAEIIPSESFFIVERGTIYPFSVGDISLLLREGKNPYTGTGIDKNKIQRIQAVLETKSNKNLIGGMLEVFDEVDEDNWEQSGPEMEKVRELRKKVDRVLSVDIFEKLCKEIKTFTENDIKYTSSPLLWSLYNICHNDIYPTDPETIQFLEEKGVKFDIKKAIEQDNMFLAEKIFEKENIDLLDWFISAVQNDQIKIARFIAAHTTLPEYILEDAISRTTTLEIVQFILELSKSPLHISRRAIYNASEIGNLDLLRFLLENGANLSNDNGDNSALCTASVHGHVEIVQLLLENGANVHAGNDCALMWASGKGHIEIVQLLLENGADIHAEYDKALIWAVRHDHENVVRLLLEKGANVSAQNNEALTQACRYASVNIVKLLLDHGADIHVDNDYPLLAAIHRESIQIVKLLLKYGANIHAREFIRAASGKQMKQLIKQQMKNE